jgi:hypothetical protein
MAVEQHRLDSGVRQKGRQEGQSDDIIRSDDNPHGWIVSRMVDWRNRGRQAKHRG